MMNVIHYNNISTIFKFYFSSLIQLKDTPPTVILIFAFDFEWKKFGTSSGTYSF